MTNISGDFQQYESYYLYKLSSVGKYIRDQQLKEIKYSPV